MTGESAGGEIVDGITQDAFEISRDTLLVWPSGRRIAIPLDGSDALKPLGGYGFRVAETDGLVFLVYYSDFATPYEIICWNELQSRQQWQAQVWANGFIGGAGRGFHHVEMRASSEHLYVFGAANDGIYIEAFSLQTGAPLFRFSTAY